MTVLEVVLYAGFFVGLLVSAIGAHWLYMERTGRYGGDIVLHIEAREPSPRRAFLLPVHARLMLGGLTLWGAALIGLLLLSSDR